MLFRKAESRSGAKLTLNFLLMKTLIFKTIAVAFFIIASLLLFIAIAFLVNLVLN